MKSKVGTLPRRKPLEYFWSIHNFIWSILSGLIETRYGLYDLSTPDLYDILDAIAALRGKLYGGTLRTGSARDQHSGSAVALLLVGHLDGRNG